VPGIAFRFRDLVTMKAVTRNGSTPSQPHWANGLMKATVVGQPSSFLDGSSSEGCERSRPSNCNKTVAGFSGDHCLRNSDCKPVGVLSQLSIIFLSMWGPASPHNWGRFQECVCNTAHAPRGSSADYDSELAAGESKIAPHSRCRAFRCPLCGPCRGEWPCCLITRHVC
jgi:hypothetical protein